MKIKPNRLQATGIYVLLVLSILLVIVSAYTERALVERAPLR